jgi:hypothetical protein
MNPFNRLVVIVLVLVLMIALTVFLVVPKPILNFLQNEAGNIAEQLDRYHDLFSLAVGVVLAVIIDIVGAFILFLEIRRPRVRAIKVQKVSGGNAVVAVDSIAKRLSYHIDQLADVISVRPKIKAQGGGVAIDLDVEISPEIDIPMKDEEIRQVATQVVEEQMGLRLRGIRPSFRDGPYPKLPAE